MNDIEWMSLYNQALAAAKRINEIMDEIEEKARVAEDIKKAA